jgi:hypothetical protein
VFDPNIGLLFFDLFNTDGILGDKFLVNGKIQPSSRSSRFAVPVPPLNAARRGSTRCSSPTSTNTQIPFWQTARRKQPAVPPDQHHQHDWVAQRMDVVIDFKQWAA